MQILGTIISILFLSWIFIFSGFWLFNFSFSKFSQLPAILKTAFAYFFGLASFISLWRLLTFIGLNARIGLYLALAGLLALAVLALKNKLWILKGLTLKNIFWLALILAGFWLIVCGLWLQVIPSVSLPFENFGSAHSVRYSNIAQYVFEQNDIPALNQNFGQALLASAPKFLGFQLNFLALNLWLTLSLFFLSLLIYGLLIYFGVSHKKSLIGAFIFLFGNTALSLTHVLSLDSNSPFGMSSYTDAACAVATFVIFLFVFYEFVKENHVPSRKLLLISFILGVYWNYAAPQSLFAAFIPAGIFALKDFWKRKTFKTQTIIFSLSLAAGAIFGSLQGGMLLPSFMREKIDLPGLAEVYRPGEYTGIKPELPYAVGWAYDWKYGTPYDAAQKAQYIQLLRGGKGLSGGLVYQILWQLESNFWAALRVMFFPLSGLLAFYFLLKKNLPSMRDKFAEFRNWWIEAIWIFLGCFILTFGIIISGRKWEMSRFMMVPYALGLILFILAVMYYAESRQARKKAYLIILGISFIMTIGPISNGFAMARRFLPNVGVFKQKLSALTQNGSIMGQEVWQEWLQKQANPNQVKF